MADRLKLTVIMCTRLPSCDISTFLYLWSGKCDYIRASDTTEQMTQTPEDLSRKTSCEHRHTHTHAHTLHIHADIHIQSTYNRKTPHM